MVGLYQIQYADGSKVDIQLCSDLNIRDWVGTPTMLPREKGTSSAVAWTGSCKMFAVIGVYRMTWVNPRPDAPIKALRFAHPSGHGVPVLMALTTIVAADQKVAADAAQKARELLSRALQALQSNDLKTARDLLQQALKTDATLAAAHQALGDIAERSGDEKAALEVYRAWAAAGASTPLPYNRIGQILEKQKDYKGALEAYTRSLKIEWNQPPIIEAKERVEGFSK
jgi:tetratricopeptide (TPR) repeat protein